VRAKRANESFFAGHREKKPQKLDQFITAMLAHETVEAAAEAAGISPATAYRWLQDSDVIRRLAEARRHGMQRAMARIQEAATQAVDTLCEVQSKDHSESARAMAARVILEMALHTVELGNIQQRLDALETIAKSPNWKGPGNDRENQAPARPAGKINGSS
jgi:hypothetical protein